jgi:hypothetical protein
MGRRSTDLEKLPEHVTAYKDRHGKRRYRFRKTGAKTYHFKVILARRSIRAMNISMSSRGAHRQMTSAAQSLAQSTTWSPAGTAARLQLGSRPDETRRTARSSKTSAASTDPKRRTVRFNHVEAILVAKAKKNG